MQADMSIASLILEASLLVQLVMLVLLLASVASWALIIMKRKELDQSTKEADSFEDRFWSGGNLSEIYAEIQRDGAQNSGLERIFHNGFREFSRTRQQATDPQTVIDTAQRAMRVAMSREMDKLEQSLPFLATVGSTSPYIGLFGTVWGIMNSFRALGIEGQATLASVAPGIAEALIATALGLFAAIPAVIAYNHFSNRADRAANRYELFIEEFTSILHRHSQPAVNPPAETA